MPKIRITDLLIYSLLFTALIAFPFNMLNIPEWSKYVIQICLSLVLLIIYISAMRKYEIKILGNENKTNLLVLLPLVIVIPCNLLTLPFAESVFINNNVFTSSIFYLRLVVIILQAINEEIIFRLFIHSQLNIKNRLLKILASAGIFAAFHLLNLINGFNINVLIQVAYTFGLGIILGFMFEYGESIVSCFIYHILFNICNSLIFGIYLSPVITNQAYYTVIGVITTITIIYLGLIYYFKLRKQEDYYF